jgi:asparagine synthase (glutamine-hydrolysing)
MCGISGIIKTAPNLNSSNEINECIGSLRHRGPDHTGIYQSEHVALMHNRLSLLDLSSLGNQPVEDEQHVLIYNGEIYNWKSLRKELDLKNYIFKSQTDTEVLFYAIKEWGLKNTLTRLKGMFAFAWYDKFENTCTLVRDRFGIKPLFYKVTQGEFRFASEIKALAGGMGMNDLNYQFLAQAYYGVYETQPHISPFRDIHQLEPGHFITVNVNTCLFTDTKWFGLEEWVDEKQYKNLDSKNWNDISAQFEDLFESSVNSMAVSDAPMGAFVSGGIDSSVIALAVSKTSSLQLFTANVVGKFSEFKYAEMLAQTLGVSLHSYDYLPDNFHRDLPNCTWHYDAPLTLFTNSVAFSGVSKLANEAGVKAVLTGEGADELFLGYPQLLSRRYERILSAPINGLRWAYGLIPGLSKFVNFSNEDLQKIVLQKHLNGFREEYKDSLVKERFYFLSSNKEALRCALLTSNQIHRHLHSLLWRNDRMGMMYSIESRFPFLDEDLVKFALNLPYRFKIAKTHKLYNLKHPFLIDKAVVRKYATNCLPKDLVYKKKFGFGVTAHLADSSPSPFNFEFFQGGFWQHACQMSDKELAFALRNSPTKLINKLASVEVWGRQFVKF